jgi:hypothetical protein
VILTLSPPDLMRAGGAKTDAPAAAPHRHEPGQTRQTSSMRMCRLGECCGRWLSSSSVSSSSTEEEGSGLWELRW